MTTLVRRMGIMMKIKMKIKKEKTQGEGRMFLLVDCVRLVFAVGFDGETNDAVASD